VVNTCGFLAAAEKESVETILEMAGYKEAGRCQKLVVAGCLVSRHAAELERELPEVDHFLGSGDLMRLDDVLRRGDARTIVEEPRYLYDDTTPRVVTGAAHSVYVKISEGCDRACSFCIIPQLRGAQRSRTRSAPARISPRGRVSANGSHSRACASS
jgi:ribosomal protein S12 methylthiotransferase